MIKKAPPPKPVRKKVGKGAHKNPEQALERYDEIFSEITRFVDQISDSEAEIQDAKAEVAEAKEALEKAKDKLAHLEMSRDGAKHSLYRFLTPTNGEILPLFDRMDAADEELHGEGAKEWRQSPISALRLSLPAVIALNDAGIMLVGQLQDRVLTNAAKWHESVPGLNAGQAASIVDKLNDFILHGGEI